MGKTETESLEAILAKLPKADRAEAHRILYGNLPDAIDIPAALTDRAKKADFEVAAYQFRSTPEQKRAPRITRVGVI